VDVLPLLGALLWATTIVVATWPLMLRVERWAGGRRSVAPALIAILMLIFIVPFALASGVLVDAAREEVALVRELTTQGIPPPQESFSEDGDGTSPAARTRCGIVPSLAGGTRTCNVRRSRERGA
jgi:predicted PurR-regulated permease PerM